MEALIELIHACRGADTDKITERKASFTVAGWLLSYSFVLSFY